MANINKIRLSGTTYNIEDSGAQRTLSAGTGIDITNNVISTTGSGGKRIVGGRGIDVTTGETADTVSFNLPISAGTYSNSIIEGSSTHANGEYSHAEGNSSQANGDYSHAEGRQTITQNNSEHASGQYNISSSASTDFGHSGNTLFSVGNGDDLEYRRNAFEIRQNGDFYIVDTSASGGWYQKPMIKLQDELRIPITSEVETILEWENNDGGDTTNYPTGASKLVFYVDESEMFEGYFFFKDDDYNELGRVFIVSQYETIDVDCENATYTISGNVVTVNYPSIAADVVKISSSYDCYWTVMAYTSDIVYEPLIDQVSANTISIQGKQDTLSAGTGISIVDNVISATGGGGGTSYSAGTGIDITNDVISVSGVVMSSEVTSAVTSGSTDVVTSGGVYDQLGGMKIVKLTESEYTALVTKDDDTLYCVVPDPSN